MPASRSILARGLEGAGPTGAVLDGGPAAPHRDGPADHGRAARQVTVATDDVGTRGRRHVQQGDADAGGPGRQPVEGRGEGAPDRPTRSVTARPRPRPGPAARSCRRGPWPSPPVRPWWHPGSPVSPRRTGGGPPVGGSTSVRPHPMRRSWPQRWLMATTHTRRFPGSAGNSMLYPLYDPTPNAAPTSGRNPVASCRVTKVPSTLTLTSTGSKRVHVQGPSTDACPVGSRGVDRVHGADRVGPALDGQVLAAQQAVLAARAHVRGPDTDAVQPGRKVREPEVESVVRTDGGERRAHVGAGEVGDHVVDAALGSDLDHDGRPRVRVGHPAAHPDAGTLGRDGVQVAEGCGARGVRLGRAQAAGEDHHGTQQGGRRDRSRRAPTGPPVARWFRHVDHELSSSPAARTGAAGHPSPESVTGRARPMGSVGCVSPGWSRCPRPPGAVTPTRDGPRPGRRRPGP